MKTAFTTFVIVSLVAVSSASADHDHRGRSARPIDLAHALHVQAEKLEHEMEHHYPLAQGARHYTYIISRLAVSTERELSHGHTFEAWRNLISLHQSLHIVDDFLRKSIANGRHDAPHVHQTVKEMEQLIGALEQSLRFSDAGHQNHSLYGNGRFDGGNSRFGGRNGRFGGGPVGLDNHGRGGHDDHDDHDHGRRGGYRGNDRVVNHPGVIYINRGGLSFEIRH